MTFYLDIWHASSLRPYLGLVHRSWSRILSSKDEKCSFSAMDA